MNTFTNFRSLALKLALGATIAALPLLHSGVAQAEGQYTAGATCVATAGGTMQYNNTAEALNAGTTSMHVVCPIDRGVFGSSGISLATVIVTDNSTTANVDCAINSKDPHSSSIHWGTGSSSGTNVNIAITMSTIHATTDDYTWVSCDIPAAVSGAKSSVQSFYSSQL